MFLTKDKSRADARCRAFIVIVALCTAGAQPAGLPSVRSITSNDIRSLAGNGDTLWALTAAGINLTIDTARDSLFWLGFKTDNPPYSLSFGAGRALVILPATIDTIPNRIWWYDHATGKDSIADIGFNRNNLSWLPDSIRMQVAFYCTDAARSGAAYWLAAVDAGLVRWDHAAKKGVVFPVNRKASSADVAGFPRHDTACAGAACFDTNLRAWLLDVASPGTDSQRVFVLTNRRIWRFNPTDTSWDTLSNVLSDQGRKVVEFKDVQVDNYVSPPGVFAFIATDLPSAGTGGSTTQEIMLYKYDLSQSPGRWIRTVDRSIRPYQALGVSFGPAGRTYLIDRDTVDFYRFADSPGIAGIPATTVGPNGSREGYATRMDKAVDVIIPDRFIRDVLCTPRDTTLRLWVATADGIFYSRNERADEKNGAAFRYYRRAPKVDEGLKSAYAYPGILTNRGFTENAGNPHATFAYNLSSDARVTIRVYDGNMDLVKTIIEKQPRLAGAKRQLGRSTEPNTDYWDGTDRFGRTVAPGVYYFQLSTDAGERAFGKIVVALQR